MHVVPKEQISILFLYLLFGIAINKIVARVLPPQPIGVVPVPDIIVFIPSTVTPTNVPSISTTTQPSILPSKIPTTSVPSSLPTKFPSSPPTSSIPTVIVTKVPSSKPSAVLTNNPTVVPTYIRSVNPSICSTNVPTSHKPTTCPTTSPSTLKPTTIAPSIVPSQKPSTCPSSAPTSSPSKDITLCADFYPFNDGYTCAQQAAWGKCSQAFMQSPMCDRSCGRCSCVDYYPGGSNYVLTCAQEAAKGNCNLARMQSPVCDVSCGRCGKSVASAVAVPAYSVLPCTDFYPFKDGYNCPLLASWGKCSQAFLQSPICDKSCGRCTVGNTAKKVVKKAVEKAVAVVASSTSQREHVQGCTDYYPYTDGYTCAQQAGWGKCGQSFMASPVCDSSCGRCTTTCVDYYPYTDGYTCAQQAGWGKCGQAFMASPVCDSSCGRCGSGTPPVVPNPTGAPIPLPTGAPIPPACTDYYPYTDGYSCAQQASWGKCGQAFMISYNGIGVCNLSCRRCVGSTPSTATVGLPTSTCFDYYPYSDGYTCSQQAQFGKCGQSFLQSPNCDLSCLRCVGGGPPTSTPIRTPSLAPIPPPTTVSASNCFDIYPYSDGYTCAQQAAWGKCSLSFMQSPYCDASCKRCVPLTPTIITVPAPTLPTSPSTCSDNYPFNDGYTCAQQAAWGKCGYPFMQSPVCDVSCGRCGVASPTAVGVPVPTIPASTCTDYYPFSDGYTCAQQAGWGKCSYSFMQSPACDLSCGRCGTTPVVSPVSAPSSTSTSCLDYYPFSDGYSCAKQAAWGKCSESFMQSPVCDYSCGRCSAATPVASPTIVPAACSDNYPFKDGYTCAQQAAWGQCGMSFMQSPVCDKSCGRCGCTDYYPFSDGHTCAQQASWGQCGQAWMQSPVCDVSCGRCVAGNPVAFPSFAPMVASSPSTVVYPTCSGLTNMLTHNGKSIFLSGINIAWGPYANFGQDINSMDPSCTTSVCTSTRSYFTTLFASVSSSGGNSVRFFMHPDGSALPVVGGDYSKRIIDKVTTAQIAGIRFLLNLGVQHNILVNICLWSFDMVNDKGYGPAYGLWNKVLTDTTVRDSYLTNWLTPVVQTFSKYESLLSFEVFNEPEGMLNNGWGWSTCNSGTADCAKVDLLTAQKFANLVASTIHTIDSTVKVTVGSWSYKASSNVNGYTNVWSDQSLISAGGKQNGVLDYYQIHFYNGFDQTINPFSNSMAHFQALDKPHVIGEFENAPTGGGSKFYEVLLQNCYAGAWGWMYCSSCGTSCGCDSKFEKTSYFSNMAYMRQQYGNIVVV